MKSKHDNGLQSRTALFVSRLRTLLIALRDSTYDLQELTAAIETSAAEHRCALCGATIASPSKPSAPTSSAV